MSEPPQAPRLPVDAVWDPFGEDAVTWHDVGPDPALLTHYPPLSQTATQELGPGVEPGAEPEPAEPRPSPAGRRARKYELQEEVARGAMGKVLRVQDNDLRRQVAMKVLLPEAQGSREGLRRFVEEARITGQLEHPHILPVHDFGVTDEGELYFTMKLVRGHTTLRDLIERLRRGDVEAHGRYTFERRVQVVQQLCHAVGHAHAQGVLHRDIKPANCVIGPAGEVYLVDWGVAAPKEGPDPDAGTLVGTPAYMSPEQIRGDLLDERSDVYSLAAVLYELLTLHHYLGDEPRALHDVLAAVLRTRPTDAEDWIDPLNGRVPRALSRICRRGLSKDRARRFGTARELEEALQGWLEGCSPVVCPGTALQRGMNEVSSAIDLHPVAMPAAMWVVIGVLLLGNLYGLYRLLSG